MGITNVSRIADQLVAIASLKNRSLYYSCRYTFTDEEWQNVFDLISFHNKLGTSRYSKVHIFTAE